MTVINKVNDDSVVYFSGDFLFGFCIQCYHLFFIYLFVFIGFFNFI